MNDKRIQKLEKALDSMVHLANVLLALSDLEKESIDVWKEEIQEIITDSKIED